MSSSTRIRRALTAAAISGLAILGSAVPASAAESITIPGCYGALVFVCDPTVTVSTGFEVYETTTPVCAGSCTPVPIVLVRGDGTGPGYVCVTAENMAGQPIVNQCVFLPPLPDTEIQCQLIDLVVAHVRHCGPFPKL